MAKNIIFYFSGTGNCLHVAQEISAAISNCEIVSIGSCSNYDLKEKYDSIGFIYPTYFLGIPLKVREFVSKLKISHKNTYFYAVTTFGGTGGNSLAQLNDLLHNQQVSLNYGAKLVMFSNYVVMYNMSKKVKEKTIKSKKNLIPIINNIQNKHSNKISKSNPIVEWYYNRQIKKIPSMDKDYTVSLDCISCGICKEVCPVGNITFVGDRPVFAHHCEQCVACIQFCPKKAINYKNLTQKRGRYTNPAVSHKDLANKNF